MHRRHRALPLPLPVLLVLLVLLLCGFTSAQNNLTLETRPAAPGTTDVDLLVTLDHVEAAGVGGFSFGLDHDEVQLTVTDLRYVGPPVVNTASFVLVDIEVGFSTIGVILFDGIGVLTLLPPGSYTVAEATYDVSLGAVVGTSTVMFAAVGTPPISIEYSTPGGPVVPTTTPGGIDVLAIPQTGTVPTNQLWLPNSGATTVSVVDSGTSTVLDTPDGAPGSTPNAVAMGRNGVVWTTYSGSNEVVRFDSNTGAPFGLTAASPRIAVGVAPSAIAIDPFDNAWVANRTDHTLTKLGAAGETLLGGGGFAGGPVAVPPGGSVSLRGIASDALGNIWIASGDGDQLHKFNNGGALALTVDLGTGAGAYGVAVDRDGFVWVTLSALNEVRRYANDGTLSEAAYPVPGATPEGIAIRGRNTAWVAGPGILHRIEPGGMGPPTIACFTGVPDPSGVAVANDGSIWFTDSTGNNATKFDDAGVPLGASVSLGTTPEFLGDASGYILANVLFPNEDFDADGVENASECDAGSNPYDATSMPAVPPVEDLTCSAVFSGVGTDWTVTLTWTIPTGASYSSIEIFRDGVSQGMTPLATDTSFVQTVSVDGDYTYTVTAAIFFPTADAECGVTVGPGNFLAEHPVGVGGPATNLLDITVNPAPLAGQPTYYVTESGTNQVLALDDAYNEIGTIPSPFAAGLPLTGIAYAACSTCGNGGAIFVGTGTATTQAMVQELELDGTPIGSPRLLRTPGGNPIIARIGALAAVEDFDNPGNVILFVSVPDTCDGFVFEFSSGSSDASQPLSFVHPGAGLNAFGLSGIAVPIGGDFGSILGGNIQLMGQDPCEVSFEIIEYNLTPGAGTGGMASLTPVGTPIPLDGIPDESVFGGFATNGPELSVTGVATSVIYELDIRRLFIRGDSNNDGTLNIADAVAILNFLFSGGLAVDPNCTEAADANGDGSVNIADAVYVLSHLFSMGAPPPAPFPEPGFDDVDNNLQCVE
ncbi:MAG: dockerin type I domain-containing protein [Planctomycetota bacterium]